MVKDIILNRNFTEKEVVLSKGATPLVIAEVGVLTFGDIEKGFRFVDAAVGAGVKLLKFQAFTAEKVVSTEDRHWLDRLKQREFPKEKFLEVMKYAENKGIVCFATTHNEYDLIDLSDCGMPILKIGSGDSNNFRMIDMALDTGKPVILSLGLTSPKEANALLCKYRKYADRLIVMHCVTLYPAPPETINLNIIDKWAAKYPEYYFGYSDHTEGYAIPLIASSMKNVSIIEKHFCLPEDRENPKYESLDIPIALTPDEMKIFIEEIKKVYLSLHSDNKISQKIKENKPWAQKSVAAKIFIAKGTKLEAKQLVSLRPHLPKQGHISIANFYDVVGVETKRDILKGSLLTKEDLKL